MDRHIRYRHARARGIVLPLALIFLCVFGVLAVSLSVMAGSNLQLATNQVAAGRALVAAESGLQVVRYWLNNLSILGTTAQDQYLSAIGSALQAALRANSIDNMVLTYEDGRISIRPTVLDRSSNQAFWAYVSMAEPNVLQLDVIGSYKAVRRAVRVCYTAAVQGNTVFDFGLATRGPLYMNGNVDMDGVNIDIESNVYIESADTVTALQMIGNCSIAGKVKIVNRLAIPDIGHKSSVGGEGGQNALKHIQIGVPSCEFPQPVTDLFAPYATTIIDSSTDVSKAKTWTNIRIAARSNPKFAAKTKLLGVVFIETPNVVEFTGNVTITGIIVGDGDVKDDFATNQIIFKGDVECYSVASLPEEFGQLRNLTGTFIVAPGFEVQFGGNFKTQAGAIAANGVKFWGNAGGIINGSIINYSNRRVELSGNTDLRFNRSGIGSAPTGFVPSVRLVYNPASYTEPPI